MDRAIDSWEELAPGADPEPLLERCRNLKDSLRPSVLIGHEPTLTEFIGLALSGDTEALAHLDRAGAAALWFEGRVDRGGARLRWLLTSEQLAAVGS